MIIKRLDVFHICVEYFWTSKRDPCAVSDKNSSQQFSTHMTHKQQASRDATTVASLTNRQAVFVGRIKGEEKDIILQQQNMLNSKKRSQL